ncbi:hypothetical protein TrVE_jg13141 [Triparma verrucosa]|uniref:NTP pyrophosphohydrolase MazG-like domain-containing protein n=1 Tax=Triparma verrucosa TaxID=1606542 RepID=A0A9W7BNP6_9STRA|nr:hypothetical protein TrVE_jg13141 [Triparma verrucosa]
MLSFFSRKSTSDLSESWSELVEKCPKSSPSRTQARSEHALLKGAPRALNLVALLNEACPWTATVKPEEMVNWLKSECEETLTEVKVMRSIDPATLPASQLSHHIRSLQSELGDVLFDALMLNSICARDFGFDPAESWHAATAKVERRTPYMKEWGEKGVTAETSEEAEELWRAAKKEEKAELAAELEALNLPPSSTPSPLQKKVNRALALASQNPPFFLGVFSLGVSAGALLAVSILNSTVLSASTAAKAVEAQKVTKAEGGGWRVKDLLKEVKLNL